MEHIIDKTNEVCIFKKIGNKWETIHVLNLKKLDIFKMFNSNSTIYFEDLPKYICTEDPSFINSTYSIKYAKYDQLPSSEANRSQI